VSLDYGVTSLLRITAMFFFGGKPPSNAYFVEHSAFFGALLGIKKGFFRNCWGKSSSVAIATRFFLPLDASHFHFLAPTLPPIRRLPD
jgi:hypothetical protein